ncbi:DUF2529 domain-containing protein [Jeotgalibacillus campisalis]|uniref:DUF2529 domain-containing protein n=1 Tax=Jeotgalibacillus campisalis TaxID=220754 RepID=A0A0C2W7X4_9BACL|nr:DUF2529 domain-containing protein [Jeotgalibacillus campisalis]KIL52681.1 hypothetical protein KR50_00100 [Jeotgalibacillus campisalis]
MLKMFTTQLSGLFSRLQGKEEWMMEDAARLLAQAAVGEGTIYIKGFEEMKGVTEEALNGEEPMACALELQNVDDLDGADRVLIVTRRSTDEDAIALARKLLDKQIPFTVISGTVKEAEEDLTTLADVHLNTQLVKGMLPDESGNRFGFPSLVAALYLYHGLKFSLDEMIAENE